MAVQLRAHLNPSIDDACQVYEKPLPYLLFQQMRREDQMSSEYVTTSAMEMSNH
jgi:hypothetical protein